MQSPGLCKFSSIPLRNVTQRKTQRKSLSTLSQKSATIAEFRRCLAVFGDGRTFLRQCGPGLTQRKSFYATESFANFIAQP